MVIKSVPDPAGLIVAPARRASPVCGRKALYELPAVLHCMEGLQETLERLRSGASRRRDGDGPAAALRPDLDSGTAALLRRVKALEDRVKSGWQPASAGTRRDGSAGLRRPRPRCRRRNASSV